MPSNTGFVWSKMMDVSLVQVRCLVEVSEILPSACLDRRVADLQNPGRWVGIALNLGHSLDSLRANTLTTSDTGLIMLALFAT